MVRAKAVNGRGIGDIRTAAAQSWYGHRPKTFRRSADLALASGRESRGSARQRKLCVLEALQARKTPYFISTSTDCDRARALLML
jgi:hypothetical protein